MQDLTEANVAVDSVGMLCCLAAILASDLVGYSRLRGMSIELRITT